jgi:hypothetical protein
MRKRCATGSGEKTGGAAAGTSLEIAASVTVNGNQDARAIMRRHGLSGDHLEWFLAELQWSRKVSASRARRVDDDILDLVNEALEAGDVDEAVWRAFLAAHFGRMSGNHDVPGQLESAGRLVCGFGGAPDWTWSKVSAAPERFRAWLLSHESDIKTLSFGNHRKYESKKARHLWRVIDSFMRLVDNHGGRPARLVEVAQVASPFVDRFELLFRRFCELARFGLQRRPPWAGHCLAVRENLRGARAGTGG